VKQMRRVHHLWIILAIMTFGAVVYYADQIPGLQVIVTQSPIQLARYSTHRILSIIPVVYTALIFRFRGGAIAAVVISFALLPRATIISEHNFEALAEIAAFLFIGLLVSWLIDQQRQAVYRLENAQEELTSSLQTIKEQQQQMTSLFAISTSTYRTLDVNQITNNALSEVFEATGAEVGWIYLKDEERGDLVLSAHRGLAPQFINDNKRIKAEQSPYGQVIQSGTPLVIKTGSPEFSLKSLGQKKRGTVLVVPLRTRTGNEGALGIASNKDQFDKKIDLVTTLGNEIGIVVEHARLHQKDRVITQQLRLSEERYRGLFENASEAIFICSSAGRIISANSACEQLTGYTQSQLIATTIYELFSGITEEMVRELFLRKLDKITFGATEELRLTKKDGSEAFIQLKVGTLLRNDQVIGLQAIASDVTEERRLRQNMDYYITQITRAQEDERLRISRELHDDTTQSLAGLSRGLDSLLSKEKELPKATIANLEKLHKMADSALEGVRRFSQDLRPSILDDLGLVPALEWLVSDLQTQYGLATNVKVTGNQRRLPPEKE